MPPEDSDVSARIDALYQRPLGEFVSARNALARALRSEGHAEASNEVKGLPKPSLSAWAVNQLWWKNREDVLALRHAGVQVTEALTCGVASTLREANERRRSEVTRLANAAATHLREAGHASSAATLRRITTTLEAIAAHGTGATAPKLGRLHDDLSSPGFELLTGLDLGPGRDASGGGAPKPEGEAISEASDRRRAAAQAARVELQRSEEAVRTAEADLKQAEHDLDRTRAERREAERALAEAERRARDVARRCEEAQQDVQRRTAALEEARRSRDARRSALQQLEDE